MSAPAHMPVRVRPIAARPTQVTGGAASWWRRHGTPLVLSLCGPAVLLLVALDAPAGIRAVPVLIYVLAVPGLAVVRLVGVADRLMEVMLGIGLSLALGMLVTQIMVYAGVWSPVAALAILVAIASLALAPAFRGGTR